MKPRDKNFGKHPLDPDYIDGYDYEKELADYELEKELEQDDKR